MITSFLTNQLDEPVYARRDLVVGALSPRPVPAASSTPTDASAMPAWRSLELHRRSWADGDALELRLDTDGEAVSRALVTRDGQFLFGPTGPSWARELAQEAANEWRAESSTAA